MLRFVLLLLTCAPLLAQVDQDAQHRARRHSDGHWTETPARARQLSLSPEETALRSTSLVLLGLTATTLPQRRGMDRNWSHKALRWLMGKIDSRGRLALRTDIHWLRDHSLGCHAMLEAICLTEMRPYFPRFLPAIRVLTRHLQLRGRMVDDETLFWAYLTCRRLERLPRGWERQRGHHGKKLREVLGVRLEQALANEAGPKADPSFLFYLRLWHAAKSEKDRVRIAKARLDPILDQEGRWEACSPADLAVYTIATYQYAGQRRRTWAQKLAGVWQEWDVAGYFSRAKVGPIDFADAEDGQPRCLEDLVWRVLTVHRYYSNFRLSSAWSPGPLAKRR